MRGAFERMSPAPRFWGQGAPTILPNQPVEVDPSTIADILEDLLPAVQDYTPAEVFITAIVLAVSMINPAISAASLHAQAQDTAQFIVDYVPKGELN